MLILPLVGIGFNIAVTFYSIARPSEPATRTISRGFVSVYRNTPPTIGKPPASSPVNPFTPRQKPAHVRNSEQTPPLSPTTFERAHRDRGIETKETSLDPMVRMNDQEPACLPGTSDNGMGVQSAQPHARFPEQSVWIATKNYCSWHNRPLCEIAETGILFENRHRHLQGESPIHKYSPDIVGISATGRNLPR